MSKGKIKETRGESTPSEARARDVLFGCRVNGRRTQNAERRQRTRRRRDGLLGAFKGIIGGRDFSIIEIIPIEQALRMLLEFWWPLERG
jgi:hypothetical protein